MGSIATDNNIINPGYANASERSVVEQLYNDVEIFYDAPKAKGGYRIPSSIVYNLDIFESFFLKLPCMKLVLQDNGNWFHNNGLQIGKKIYLTIRPQQVNDKLFAPLLDIVMSIQSVVYKYEPNIGASFIYINCIYPAEGYLNKIFNWPVSSVDDPPTDVSENESNPGLCHYTSSEVLGKVLPSVGLKFSTNLKTSEQDSMLWINSNNTYLKFAENVMEHAWISDNDCPLLYIDKEGNAVYTSIDTLTSSISKATYVHSSLRMHQDKKNPEYVRYYNSVIVSNVGYIQHRGAYGIKLNMYNPYNTSEISLKEFPVNNNNKTINGITDSTDCYFRQKDFTGVEKPFMAALSNRSEDSIGNVRYNTNMMWFETTHQYYDYAPMHNLAVKNAFFQQFVTITVSILEQQIESADKSQLLQLGDKITIRFDEAERQKSINNGDYIVVGIDYNWSIDSSLTMRIKCVCDGLYNIGDISRAEVTKEG